MKGKGKHIYAEGKNGKKEKRVIKRKLRQEKTNNGMRLRNVFFCTSEITERRSDNKRENILLQVRKQKRKKKEGK